MTVRLFSGDGVHDRNDCLLGDVALGLFIVSARVAVFLSGPLWLLALGAVRFLEWFAHVLVFLFAVEVEAVEKKVCQDDKSPSLPERDGVDSLNCFEQAFVPEVFHDEGVERRQEEPQADSDKDCKNFCHIIRS